MVNGTFLSSFFWGKSSLLPALEAVSTNSPSTLAAWYTLVGNIGRKEMVVAFCGAVPMVYGCFQSFRRKNRDGKERETRSEDGQDVHDTSSTDTIYTDPGLIRKHSEVISVTTDEYMYPGVRIFCREHLKASVLPPKLPLLVFLHGFGGQVSAFRYLLEYFVHISHTLAIDLPGCGPDSEFSPQDWGAYTTPSLASVVANVVNGKLEEGQKVILIGHSMGCSLAATLVTKGGLLADKCVGLIAICPKAIATEKERKAMNTFISIPEAIFSFLRAYDRRGGTSSKSVNRFVGSNASEQARKLQLRFNEQSRTPVWRRMVKGFRLPTEDEWTMIKCPIYLIGAAEDKITTTKEVDLIHSWFNPANKKISVSGSGSGNSSSTESPPSGECKAVVKKCIIPGAGHAVMLETPHVLNGLIGEFISKHINEIISMGWQLSYLKEDKWLLKNLEKWTRTQSVSPRVVGFTADEPRGKVVRSPFRAMKTLRQNDSNGHNPADFVSKWPDVNDIIDISHEQPPYDPETLGSGVKYHKFPTVSKMPPTPDEVAAFIKLVDSIREAREYDENSIIACHCHYGFNRTGFFVCSYLIQRLNFTVPKALEAFQDARPPGIRHLHFINELFERHCLGLERAPTY